jgi:hypothetical protein
MRNEPIYDEEINEELPSKSVNSTIKIGSAENDREACILTTC